MRLRFALLSLAGALLACNTLLPAGSLPAAPVPNPLVKQLPSATPPAPLPEGVRACDFVPGVSTPAPPLAAAVGTPMPYPLPALPANTPVDRALTRAHLVILQDIWQTVNDEYISRDFNGHDWRAIGDKYRALVQAGLTDEDFYFAMDRMLVELGDDHSFFEPPDFVAESEAQFAGANDYVGIGVHWTATPETGRGVIILTFPGSPAAEAGLQAHDSILQVNGQPIVDADGNVNDAFRGPEGTPFTLTVAHPGGAPFEVRLSPRRVTGSLPIAFCLMRGPRIAYLFLPGLDDRTIPGQVGEALRRLTADGPLNGLVLDNRENPGGESTVLEEVLSFFTSGRLGTFVGRTEQRPLDIRAHDVGGSQTVPLVVLVDVDTASFGEIMSGVLQSAGRARVVGQTTYGNVETLWGYDFADGSRAWIAHDAFQPLNQRAGLWEDTGIVPEVSVPTRWDLFTEATDPALAAAVELLTQP